MSGAKLEEDLSNCLINFDRRVLITELLDDYQLSYDEANTIIHNFLIEQEKKEKLKFEKKYLVHGLLEDESQKVVYKVVEEALLKEWLSKLQNSESSLYSVEVAGGAKAAAPVFKPMKVVECVQAKTRQATKSSGVNGQHETYTATGKKPVKEENQKELHVKLPPTTTKNDSSVEKISPKAETTPPEHKAADKKAFVKKGLNNFFAPITPTVKKSDDAKQKKAVVKPPTPKKMMDFFKKQTEKPASSTENIKKPDNNTSVQLFDDNEEEPEDVESSDEEEKLEALKRDIISSDVEMEDEEDECKQKAKRRRILDSEDEEAEPPVKQEKMDTKVEIKAEEEAVAETYLDEEGFVITKKSKQKATSNSSKTTTANKAPPVTIKAAAKETKKSSSSKETKANPAAKTKQAGIMNFFCKK